MHPGTAQTELTDVRAMAAQHDREVQVVTTAYVVCRPTVAGELERLSATGFAGATVSFVNDLAEFPYFRDEVIPRLAAAGLRQPL